MTPLFLFLLGGATVFLGVVQAAFSALMRLSLRLMAERGGRDDRLGHYLDDPLQLFLPVRLLIGVCTVLAGALIARHWSRWSRQEFYRDTMPIRYWMQMGGTAFGSLLCLVGAIIGWAPNS